MILVYSLIFAILLSLIFTSSIKKNPWYYYSLAIIVATATTIFEIYKLVYNVKLSGFIQILEIASIKGIIPIAFFALVMFAGVLCKKWLVTRKLLIIRSQLAIIASILMLPHGIIYLVKFLIFSLPGLFSSSPFPLAYFTFTIIGIIAFFIMLPLFITSFKEIRIKMKGSDWKKYQKCAYIFYLLSYLHIIIILLNDDTIDWLKIITYTVIFGAYTIGKLIKCIKIRNS